MTLSSAWEQHAQEWIVWARTPNHDGFWAGTWPELRAVLPPPGGLVVEIGCGEGRVGRALLELGHTVVGVERSATLARAARHASVPLMATQADAARLPIGDALASTVVACMSLHDVDDLRATVDEAARVLRPGGRFCVAMVHPFATAQEPPGWWRRPSTMNSDPTVLSEPYLSERRLEDHVERGGLEMTFVSTHRPLSAYVSAFVDCGLILRELRELGPKPIPWLLVARLERAR
jgi:SAM-dependent methyltransferase